MLAIGWTSVILYATLSPADDVPYIEIPHFDKLVHFGLFFVEAIFLLLVPISTRRNGWSTLVLATALGLGTELLQVYVPGREADAMDWLADSLGIICAIAMRYVWRLRWASK